MPAPDHRAWSRLWSTLRQSSRPHLSWSSAIWRGVLVGVFVTIGAFTGNLELGAAVGFGALGPAMLPPTMTRVDIIRICLVLTIVVPSLGLVAILLAESWWLLLFMPAVGYFFGCIANAGPAAAMLTVPSMGASIALTATPIPVVEALWAGLFLFFGSLIGTTMALLSWRFERTSELRKAIGSTLATLDQLAREGKGDGKLTLVSASAISSSAMMLSQARLPYKTHSHFAEVLQTANQLRLTLTAWIATEPERETRNAVADELGLLGSAFLRDDPRTFAVSMELPSDVLRDLGVYAAAITGHSMVPVTLPQGNEPSTPVWLNQMGGMLLPNGPVARQGLRLALGMAVSTLVWLVTDIGHGYWIAMALAMVLKSDYVTTLTKGVLRIAGTLASVIVLAGMLAAFGHTATTYSILLIIAIPFMIHWVLANYFLASLAIATTMLLLSEAIDPSFTTAGERMIDTIIGCVIAVVVFLLIPAWRGGQLPEALRQIVQYLHDWSLLVFDIAKNPVTQANPISPIVPINSPTTAMDRSQQVREVAMRTRLAMVTTAPIVDAALIEPHRTKYDPGEGLAVFVAAEGVGIAALALEMSSVEHKEPEDQAAVAQTRQQILDDLAAAIHNLESPDAVQAPVQGEVQGLPDYPHTSRLAERARQLRRQTEVFWR